MAENYPVRPKMECWHCGQSIDVTNVRRHAATCGRLPDGDTLAAMLDNDKTLTAYAIAQKFDVPLPVTFAKIIATTDWSRDQLVARGEWARAGNVRNTTAANTKQKHDMIADGVVFCMFCEIAGDRSVCGVCESALTRFIEAGSISIEWARVLFRLLDSRQLPDQYVDAFDWLWSKRNEIVQKR